MTIKLQFRDFIPADRTAMLALSRTYETLPELIGRANQWIAEGDIRVLNVETLLLPSLKSSDGTTSTSVEVSVGAMALTQWFQVLRVWYSEQ